MAEYLRILVTGSRNWTDWNAIATAIGRASTGWSPSSVTVVHGACPTGADAIADELADRFGFTVERHPADWDRHGRAAGPIRNQEMVNLGADVCLALPLGSSRGTYDCMSRAKAACIPVRVIKESSDAD